MNTRAGILIGIHESGGKCLMMNKSWKNNNCSSIVRTTRHYERSKLQKQQELAVNVGMPAKTSLNGLESHEKKPYKKC
ncbi:Hypothetical protein CINCED_3A013149 [Cinara cedri]|uniref:Uncharacterized protein n=1 Tax=Cinara cedri TaxID=506608 RepID=A0A5E4NMB6_9HEMI|nr:Hypothetical protein CINCED_3A013149 [Cinara cedri]